MKRIEHEPHEAGKDYPNWIHTPIEWILRVLIIIVLLLLVGKIYPNHFQQFFKEVPEVPKGQGVELKLYHVGSLIAFFLLIIWNILAAKYRRRYNKTMGNPIKDEVQQRIKYFILACIMPLAYWLIIVISGDHSNCIALSIFVGLYCFFLVMALKGFIGKIKNYFLKFKKIFDVIKIPE